MPAPTTFNKTFLLLRGLYGARLELVEIAYDGYRCTTNRATIDEPAGASWIES